MHTVMTLLALLPHAPESERLTLTFELDYKHARTIATSSQKPIAVFVGSGAEGWSKLVRNGNFELDSLKLMADRFVLVYADVETESGRKLATALQLGKQGLVISNRGGELQVFRHDGELEAVELTRHLTRCCDPYTAPPPLQSFAPARPPVVQAIPTSFQPYQNPFTCPT
jgi:hypothetical protein